MTDKKLRQIIAKYRAHLGTSVEPAQCLDSIICPDATVVLCHIRYMLDRMDVFLDDGRSERAHRWLPFVQACFWMIGDFSLNDLSEHNRANERDILGNGI